MTRDACSNNVAVIILAAGLGKRMRSGRAKVLHEVLGKPIVMHVLEAASELVCSNIVVVVGHQADEVKRVVSERFCVRFALQEQQLGTGHAVKCALPHLPEETEHVIVLCGDVPLIQAHTLFNFLDYHRSGEFDVSVLTVVTDRPIGYGRIIQNENGCIDAIVEEVDATEEQKKIRKINSGIYCAKRSFLQEALRMVKADNAQGEFYLTDIVSIGRANFRSVGAFLCENFDEVLGVNTLGDLEMLEAVLRKRISKIS